MIKVYYVDAFAEKLFEGNPAAVCPLEKWIPEETMQSIASENNLSETAFFCVHEKPMQIRWFTPKYEVKLCGHATLATAHVLKAHLNFEQKEILFQSKSGILKVTFSEDQYVLDFPADDLTLLDKDHEIRKCFSSEPLEIWKGGTDYLLRYRNQVEIENLQVDFARLALDESIRGVICTGEGREDYDFVSRCFYPSAGINEDPVTGSAHTSLAVYWAKATGKTRFQARQVSERGGNIGVELIGDRVQLTGKAITYLEGEIML